MEEPLFQGTYTPEAQEEEWLFCVLQWLEGSESHTLKSEIVILSWTSSVCVFEDSFHLVLYIFIFISSLH